MITLFVLVPSYTAPGANPSRTPVLAILVGLMTIVAVVSINTGSIGGLGKVVGGGHIIMAIWGWWVVVFGNGRGKLTTKGKKHTPERFKRL